MAGSLVLLDTSALLTLHDDEPGATLLHKDPEFRAIADLPQTWLG